MTFLIIWNTILCVLFLLGALDSSKDDDSMGTFGFVCAFVLALVNLIDVTLFI